MLPQWVIEKKRDGAPLSEKEIRWFIDGYANSSIPDYQMSALAMAIFFQGMSFEEVTFLTNAMMDSGSVLDNSELGQPTADKHSTGGVGDKVSLILAPLAACCDIAVPMLSGRGLGITGGTLDKLASIPGYRTDLSIKEFMTVLRQCGCSIIGQTSELAPADKKLYALRDVTGTVPSIPLISASIMSKKLAESTDALVLDVKWGKGAFMKTLDQARALAKTMVEIGSRMNRKMEAIITDMNQPLGRTAGNSLEIIETIEALKGNGPDDLMTVTLELTASMLILTGKAPDRETAINKLKQHINSGAAFNKFREMVKLQGGSTGAIDTPSLLPSANIQTEYTSTTEGYITDVDADAIGRACILLGAGRSSVDDKIDPAAGVSNILKIGQSVKKGTTLLTIHANDSSKEQEARTLLDKAFKISAEPVTAPELIVERMG